MHRDFKSLTDLARHFDAVARRMPAAKRRMLDGVGKRVRDTARAKFGEYNPGFENVGPFGTWKELAESTQEQRRDLGFTPNDPLLRSGGLRDSVDFKRDAENQVAIGSPDPVMRWQEIGTSDGHIPPRPVLGPSMVNNKHRNIDAILKEIVALFRGTR